MAEKPTYEELEKKIQELEQLKLDHQKIEKALQESQSRFKLLYERTPLAYQSLDQNGNFIEINRSWTDVMGYSREEVIGKSFSEFLHPDSKDHFNENFPRFKAIGEILGVEFEMVKKDGSLILVSFHGRIGKNKYGDFQQTHCILQDVTEQKKIEEALLETEWKFKALFEKGPIGVAYHKMIYDISGKPIDYFFLDANDTYNALTGVDPKGKNVTQAFPGIENDPFDWIGTFGHVAQTGEQIRFEQYLQLNGQWYDCVAYQYKQDHFVAAFLNITERKQAEKEREELIVELQAALEKVKTLSGLLPICASCKKIRDDKGYWNQIETYIQNHSEAEFSHGICPDCAKTLYPDIKLYPES